MSQSDGNAFLLQWLRFCTVVLSKRARRSNKYRKKKKNTSKLNEQRQITAAGLIALKEISAQRCNEAQLCCTVFFVRCSDALAVFPRVCFACFLIDLNYFCQTVLSTPSSVNLSESNVNITSSLQSVSLSISVSR